jgi:hypothetical protein
VKLGKLAPRHDPRTLRLARYVDASRLPTPPASTARAATRHTALEMFGNDVAGDCTFAGVGNLVQFWRSLTDRGAPLTDEQVIGAYEKLTGYVPGDESTDNGAVELDVLRTWRKDGIGGHRIEAFAAVDLADEELLTAACWLFDGLYIGVELPRTAQHQDVWDVDPAGGSAAFPGSWGGHCVVLLDYNTTGPVYGTWGALKQATWAWQRMYCDEAYALLTVDQVDEHGATAEGFDLEQLRSDLALVA